MKRFAFAIFLTLIILNGALSCGKTDAITNTTEATTAALQDAIDSIRAESSSWQSELDKLTGRLTDASQSSIRNEVQNLANNTIAAAGSEFRCNVDFLSHRVVDALVRIKAGVLHQPVPDRPPSLCKVVPTALDLNLEPSRRAQIDISGYDFDNQPDLRLFLLKGPIETDVTNALNITTTYHAVINLGANGVPLSNKANKLILRYKKDNLSSIAIIQPSPDACAVEDVEVEPGTVEFLPPRTAGDKEFAGHGPAISCSVDAFVEGNAVKAKIEMTAKEVGGDTKAHGINTVTLYKPPSDHKILSINSDTHTEQTYQDKDHKNDTFDQGNAELVKRFTFVGDVPGPDAGVATQVSVRFNPLSVRIKQTNCN